MKLPKVIKKNTQQLGHCVEKRNEAKSTHFIYVYMYMCVCVCVYIHAGIYTYTQQECIQNDKISSLPITLVDLSEKEKSLGGNLG